MLCGSNVCQCKKVIWLSSTLKIDFKIVQTYQFEYFKYEQLSFHSRIVEICPCEF